MIRHIVPVVVLLALGGCTYQTEAQINAELARHVGQSETALVRQMGVPTRSFDSGGRRFLAYYKGDQQITSFTDSGFGGGFGYGPGFGYGGWGGYGGFGGWGGWGFGGGFTDGTIRSLGCETTFEVTSGQVVRFTRHGNAC